MDSETIAFLRDTMRDGLKELEFFFDDLSRHGAAREASEVDGLKAQFEELSVEARSQFWEWNYPVHWRDVFQANLTASHSLNLVAFFEWQLGMVLHQVGCLAEPPLRESEIRGSTLERARKWLTVFGGFGAPDLNAWHELELIMAVRNCLAHGGGLLDHRRSEQRVRAFIATRPDLSLENNFLVIQPLYCTWTAQTIGSFLETLYDELGALEVRMRGPSLAT